MADAKMERGKFATLVSKAEFTRMEESMRHGRETNGVAPPHFVRGSFRRNTGALSAASPLDTPKPLSIGSYDSEQEYVSLDEHDEGDTDGHDESFVRSKLPSSERKGYVANGFKDGFEAQKWERLRDGHEKERQRAAPNPHTNDDQWRENKRYGDRNVRAENAARDDGGTAFDHWRDADVRALEEETNNERHRWGNSNTSENILAAQSRRAEGKALPSGGAAWPLHSAKEANFLRAQESLSNPNIPVRHSSYRNFARALNGHSSSNSHSHSAEGGELQGDFAAQLRRIKLIRRNDTAEPSESKKAEANGYDERKRYYRNPRTGEKIPVHAMYSAFTFSRASSELQKVVHACASSMRVHKEAKRLLVQCRYHGRSQVLEVMRVDGTQLMTVRCYGSVELFTKIRDRFHVLDEMGVVPAPQKDRRSPTANSATKGAGEKESSSRGRKK